MILSNLKRLLLSCPFSSFLWWMPSLIVVTIINCQDETMTNTTKLVAFVCMRLLLNIISNKRQQHAKAYQGNRSYWLRVLSWFLRLPLSSFFKLPCSGESSIVWGPTDSFQKAHMNTTSNFSVKCILDLLAATTAFPLVHTSNLRGTSTAIPRWWHQFCRELQFEQQYGEHVCASSL